MHPREQVVEPPAEDVVIIGAKSIASLLLLGAAAALANRAGLSRAERLVGLDASTAFWAGVFAIGAGTSFTWIEPERRMVLVVRWIDANHADEFFRRVLQALDDPAR